MGSNEGDGDEKPVHRVRVATFELARTEVTVAQYRACVRAGACSDHHLTGYEWPGQAFTESAYCNWGQPGREDHPMNCVDWKQARAFARWAGGRLPSEAEWEYAARSGGRDITYPWGSGEATCERAVIDHGGRGCGKDRTWPVCSKPAGRSAQGVCDLAGNVWEWTEDCWHGSYEGAPADGSAWTGCDPGAFRVFRGGSWSYSAWGVRSAFRSGSPPADRCDYLGLRPARSNP